VGRVEETHSMKAFKLSPEERIVGLVARGLGDGKLMDVQFMICKQLNV
jgi:hypothetical protein